MVIEPVDLFRRWMLGWVGTLFTNSPSAHTRRISYLAALLNVLFCTTNNQYEKALIPCAHAHYDIVFRGLVQRAMLTTNITVLSE